MPNPDVEKPVDASAVGEPVVSADAPPAEVGTEEGTAAGAEHEPAAAGQQDTDSQPAEHQPTDGQRAEQQPTDGRYADQQATHLHDGDAAAPAGTAPNTLAAATGEADDQQLGRQSR